MLNRQTRRPECGGFTLVEMMVAMALGLIVIASVLAFIFSLIRANSSTVLDTRLNQELRATMAVISAELTRARSIQDPISAVSQAGAIDYDNNGQPGQQVDIDFPKITVENSGSCVRYAYHDGVAVRFRAIYLQGNKIGMDTGTTLAAATCGGGTALNTADGVNITGLLFEYDPGATGKRRFSISLSGELADPPAYMANAALGVSGKTLRQVVAIRSNDA